MVIDFENLGMPVFTGRDRGQKARHDLKLDSLAAGEVVQVRIPEETYAVTSSYFLGLFGPSVRELGGEGFEKQFQFSGPDFILSKIPDWIQRALRDKRDIFGRAP
ncbi:hypothetical protein [Dyella japonica]|uniref:DUF4325 domain-containing protein n=1 Tax=Dyella japonica A8 TaxID=1217721 RepID=A0A075K7T1_9GAMM|nr:hypothetical protein [Dyella japonica]AIF48203.1 hypothetical protein HY57_13535 [Dyella japonica A8]